MIYERLTKASVSKAIQKKSMTKRNLVYPGFVNYD